MSAEAPAKLELVIAGRGLKELPPEVGIKKGHEICKLDLSDNQLTDLTNFDGFTVLDTLVLDNNQISTVKSMPKINSLTTIWLNNNKISDLVPLCDTLAAKAPNLTYLSMLKNPACPNVYFSDGEEGAYRRYRLYIIYRLKKLQFLDSTPVTPEERAEANQKGSLMVVAKPKSADGLEEEYVAPVRPSPSAAAGEEPKQPKAASFLNKGKPRYDGSNSEGNRFIMNDDL